MDLYEVLGISANATDEQIRRQYRELAKQLHPDLNGGVAKPGFTQLQEAYDTLSNQTQRRAYDKARAAELAELTRRASTQKTPTAPAAPTGLPAIENIDGRVTLGWTPA